jgi:selenoprotein W-related protein
MGKVLPKFKQRLDEVILVPSDGGRFEISFNDDLIYSKVETGSFPDEDEIVATIEERIEQAVS